MIAPVLFIGLSEVVVIRSLGADDDRSTCLSNHLLLTLVESGAKASPCVAIHLHPASTCIENVVDVADDDSARVL